MRATKNRRGQKTERRTITATANLATKKPRVRRTKPTKPGRGPQPHPPRARVRARMAVIDSRLKTLTIAAEPPIDADPNHLGGSFRANLLAALSDLETASKPFKLVEGFRTLERQQWLYGSGRPNAPYGRPGPILTNADGVNKKSAHQGEGTPATGGAADCYPLKNGSVYIPSSSDPIWKAYADTVQVHGLVAGYYWPMKDSPHCEKSTS